MQVSQFDQQFDKLGLTDMETGERITHENRDEWLADQGYIEYSPDDPGYEYGPGYFSETTECSPDNEPEKDGKDKKELTGTSTNPDITSSLQKKPMVRAVV